MIRLELASSAEFPKGSAGRSYLIRLPVTESGTIDAESLMAQPNRATVRRFWPNEADVLGYLVNSPRGFAIRYETSGSARMNGNGLAKGRADQPLFQFGAESIKIGEQISLTGPDGRELRFRIASLH